MDQKSIVQQTQVENEAVEFVTQALARTLEWPVEGKEFSRKLSSLRFVTESLQRHLERLFALEELDGYMDLICQHRPELTDRVDALQKQQDKLRISARQLVLQLERTSPTDLVMFAGVCEQLTSLVDWIRTYHQSENALLTTAGLRDSAGQE
jgi:hypothetical protein